MEIEHVVPKIHIAAQRNAQARTKRPRIGHGHNVTTLDERHQGTAELQAIATQRIDDRFERRDRKQTR